MTTKVFAKGLALLEALAEPPGEAGLSDLARTIGFSKATAHRFLTTLVDAGYVVQDAATSRYRLTARLYDIASKASAPRSIMEAAYPVMRQVVQKTGETAYVAVLVGAEAVFLDKVDCEQPVRVYTVSGARIPLHCGSAAKTLLAFQTNDEVLNAATRNLTAITKHTITSKTRLLKDLETIRARGYAIGEQEWRDGVSGVAAPVRNSFGSVVAALAISGPTIRLPNRRLHALAPHLVEAAHRLSQDLGWRDGPGSPPSPIEARKRTRATVAR